MASKVTLTMVAILYAVAALGVAIYMVAALTRPDKF
jgi:K+-transporting ATPase KdpF subunit